MLSCGWLFRDVVCYFAIRYSAFEHIGLRETPAFHPSELVDIKAGGSHANRPLCAVRSYGRNPMPPSSVMVSPLIYLKSGDASCTQARPISFSTSPKCPIGGIFTFALNCLRVRLLELLKLRGPGERAYDMHIDAVLSPIPLRQRASSRGSPPWPPRMHTGRNCRTDRRRMQS